jgi:beta propeller repeat protein
MRNKILFIAVALVCLIGSISITSAQVTKIGTGQNPAIYSSKVTWSDTAGSIHIYDLTAKKNTKISSSNATYPAIYGNKLVWHDESSGTPRLTVFDIPSGARSYITKNVDSTSIPKIYGNRIVWSANYNPSNYDYNVYMRDISTSTQTQIAVGNSPDIYGTRVTYVSAGEDFPQVNVYDVLTKITVKASSGGDCYRPHIYGNNVIWSDFYTGTGYIKKYDLTTKNTIDVTHDVSWNPDGSQAGDDTGFSNAIYSDKIVYAKIGTDMFGSAGIYAYSSSTGQSTQVIKYANGVYTTPAIYGTTVAWGFSSGWNNNPVSDKGIYVCDLAAKPVASFTADKVSGTHSLPVNFTYIGAGGGTPDSYHWDFGDKIASNHALTATHTYTKAGTYTVSLTVTNAAGSSTAAKTAYIKVS